MVGPTLIESGGGIWPYETAATGERLRPLPTGANPSSGNPGKDERDENPHPGLPHR